MFSTTCWQRKSICVRAAEPLLITRETENIWRIPTRTSAMIVIASRTSTKLDPRARRRRGRHERRPLTASPTGLVHPGARGVLDLFPDPHAPDGVDAQDVARARPEVADHHVHVRQDERGGPGDLEAARDVDRPALEVAHEGAPVVPVRRVVRPERRLDLRDVRVR